MRSANLPSEITWLDAATVMAVHEAQVDEHGGGVGVRDESLLESALNRPKQHAAHADPVPDIPTLAALYGIAFVRNHPFIDGNKRVGFVVLELFLRLNGYALQAGNDACVTHVLALAAGDESDGQLTAWVRAHAAR